MRKIWIPSVVALVALGQQQPPARVPAAPPTKFTANSNLVIVNVTVKDKSGHAIENLGKDDFVVLEDGKPQKVTMFEQQKLTLDPEPPEPPPSLEDKNALPDPPKTTISSAGKDKIMYHDKRLIAMFFDFSNMEIPDQLRAQDAALKFLNEEITSSDLVAVLLFTTTVQVKTDFTADRMVLTDIIKGLPIGDSSENCRCCRRCRRQRRRYRRGFRRRRDRVQYFQYRSQAGCPGTGRAEAGHPAREEGPGLYHGRHQQDRRLENQAQLEASINAAVKSNVAIYPIDARGLMADPPGGAASKASSRGGMSLSTYNSAALQHQRFAGDPGHAWRPTPAARHSSTATTCPWASCRCSRSSAAITSSATTPATTPWTASTARSPSSSRTIPPPSWNSARVTTPTRCGEVQRRRQGTPVAGGADVGRSASPTSPSSLEVDYFRISPTAYFVPFRSRFPAR